jgi:hypothetical protein
VESLDKPEFLEETSLQMILISSRQSYDPKTRLNRAVKKRAREEFHGLLLIDSRIFGATLQSADYFR